MKRPGTAGLTIMPQAYSPEMLREKINAGLTADQAIEVLQRQADHDSQEIRAGKEILTTNETFATGARRRVRDGSNHKQNTPGYIAHKRDGSGK